MNNKFKKMLGIVLSLILLTAGCARTGTKTESAEDSLNVVATTTMLADLAGAIGGEHVRVNGLMGPGIDPHLYQASAGDVERMQKADIVVYNGLHLEGKMSELFENLSDQDIFTVCIEKSIDRTGLLISEDDGGAYDPHIWFDVTLWKQAAQGVAEGFAYADPANADSYIANLEQYLNELDELNAYIQKRAAELPKEQRVLITAHDAFQYFGNAYGFEVRGLQGISTDAEAGTGDVSALASFIVERRIKAVFVESSVPPKTIEALQAAVKAQGFDVAIGGELYSDSLGGEGSGDETYVQTFRSNINTIVDALKS